MGFREYFDTQASIAEDLCNRKFVLNACITATSSLDALAEIWEHDSSDDARALGQEFGGSVPGAARMSRFVHTFLTGDPRSRRISVLRLAEDISRFAPHIAPSEVAALLAARRMPPNSLLDGSTDCDADALSLQAPLLMSNPGVRRLAVEYQYPGLLYAL